MSSCIQPFQGSLVHESPNNVLRFVNPNSLDRPNDYYMPSPKQKDTPRRFSYADMLTSGPNSYDNNDPYYLPLTSPSNASDDYHHPHSSDSSTSSTNDQLHYMDNSAGSFIMNHVHFSTSPSPPGLTDGFNLTCSPTPSVAEPPYHQQQQQQHRHSIATTVQHPSACLYDNNNRHHSFSLYEQPRPGMIYNSKPQIKKEQMNDACLSMYTPQPSKEDKPTIKKPPRSRGRRVSNIPSNGSRMFICKADGCGKVFKRSEHLKRHIRSIHTLEKPFECPYQSCNKRFSRSDNLNQHIRIHRHSNGGPTKLDKQQQQQQQQPSSNTQRQSPEHFASYVQGYI